MIVKTKKEIESRVKRHNKTKMISFFHDMYLIRQFEIVCGEHYTLGHIRGFLHLYSGQEAVAVGSINALNSVDYITTHYRDHGHALARGVDPNRVMSELFGMRQGTSKGKGGSMHIFDVARNFMGGHAIVGAQIPVAVGIGLSLKYQKKPNVSMCFLGDGSTANGVYHEALNLAGLWQLPVLFVLENNGYGMGTAVERARISQGGSLSKHVKGVYDIDTYEVDGMDVLEIYELTSEVVASMRKTQRPAFIEAYTYRYEGHSLADGQKYRTKNDIEEWRSKDPILTFPNLLLANNYATESELSALKAKANQTVAESVQYALNGDDPDTSELWDDIYA